MRERKECFVERLKEARRVGPDQEGPGGCSVNCALHHQGDERLGERYGSFLILEKSLWLLWEKNIGDD